jgi:hypothetical protein
MRAMQRDTIPADWDYEEAIDDFFERLLDVSVDEARAMTAAWGAIDPAERTAAWALVRAETKAAKRQSALDDARDAVLRWAGDAVHSLEGSPYSFTYGDDLQRRESRNDALPPVIDAAAATIVRDRLADDIYDVLFGPWALGIEPAPEGRTDRGDDDERGDDEGGDDIDDGDADEDEEEGDYDGEGEEDDEHEEDDGEPDDRAFH